MGMVGDILASGLFVALAWRDREWEGPCADIPQIPLHLARLPHGPRKMRSSAPPQDGQLRACLPTVPRLRLCMVMPTYLFIWNFPWYLLSIQCGD